MEMKSRPEKWISLPDLPVPTVVSSIKFLDSIVTKKGFSQVQALE